MSGLREMIGRGEFVAAPGVHDGFSARLAQRFAFNAVYMSGYCIAASRYGLPDTGLIALNDMIEGARLIRRCVSDRPLIGDADTGYGGLVNVQHTVREYEAAGVSAIQIEDQEMPKKCGHTRNKRVVSCEEMTAKIEVAAESKRTHDFLVIARTDSLASSGMGEAIRRCREYRRAGADVVFIDALRTVEEVKQAGSELGGPEGSLMINISPRGGGFLSLELSTAELQAMGYAIAIYPLLLGYPALAGMEHAAEHFLSTGRVDYGAEPARYHSHELLGFPQVWADEERWRKRYGEQPWTRDGVGP